jgi:hypothetical protein
MLKRVAVTALVLCPATLAIPTVAQAQPPDARVAAPTPTKVFISLNRSKGPNGSVIFAGMLRTDNDTYDVDCRFEATVTLYRTVNTGFGVSTKKVATFKTPSDNGTPNPFNFRFTTRRSGTYYARTPSSRFCRAGVSRKIKYTRPLG